MSNKENPADPFKKALADTTKTLADDRDMTVNFTVDPPGLSDEGVRLPQVTRRMTRDEVLLARGTADSYAMRRKHHNQAALPKELLELFLHETGSAVCCKGNFRHGTQCPI